MSKETRAVLLKYWGYNGFRPKQEDIVDAAVAGHDSLALLPTGGGKSICFQVPGMCLDGITLVVTPLIALMKDQVLHLKRIGIPAAAIYSGMHFNELELVYNQSVFGKLKFLYISPERLITERFIEAVRRMKVSLIAIDESHCISQWGYDFRPPYLRIAEIRLIFAVCSDHGTYRNRNSKGGRRYHGQAPFPVSHCVSDILRTKECSL